MDETRISQGDPPGTPKAPGSRRLSQALVGVFTLLLAATAYTKVQEYRFGRELLLADPDRLPSDAAFVTQASKAGKAAFAANCVFCHGADMKGSQAKGVPDLTDNVWLYDFGRVSEIERTILYGVRSGLSKSHNVTDMPAIGFQKILAPDEIKDVIAYTLSLSKHPEDAAAVERGEKLFQDKGVCYDCHSRDATGIPDYGAPNLTDDEWVYGGDEKTVYKSIYDGRHGRCPAWIGKLSFATIREIAVYIHQNSEESLESPSNRSANGPFSAERNHG